MLEIPDITFEKLRLGKLKKELPEFYELKKVIENNSWHNNETTFEHTLAVLNELQKFLKSNRNLKLKAYLNNKVDNYKRKELLFLATVFHDLGKKETIVKSGKFSSFPKHEKISIEKAKRLLKDFDLTKKEKDIVIGIIKKHSDLHTIVEEENDKIEKQLQKIKNAAKEYFLELVIMVIADTACSYLKTTNPEKFKFRINFYKNLLKRKMVF